MSSLISPVPLKSERVGRALMGFLWFGLGLAIFSGLLSLLEVTAPSIYAPLEILDALQGIAGFVVYWITIVIFLVWMYRLHCDLRELFDGYPITPGAALALELIPCVNVFGIWHIFTTLANRLRSEGGDLIRLGSSLRSWLPWLYIVGFVSNYLKHGILQAELSSTEEVVPPTFLLLSAGADIILYIIWLQMARIIRSAMTYIATRDIE